MTENGNGARRAKEAADSALQDRIHRILIYVVTTALVPILLIIGQQAVSIDAKLQVLTERGENRAKAIQANQEKLMRHEDILRDHDRELAELKAIAKSIEELKQEIRRRR